MITKEQALQLKHGDELHYHDCRVTMGEHGGIAIQQVRARVSGQVKTWKRMPDFFRVPIKHGMYETGYVDHANASHFHLGCECPLVTDQFLKLITTPIIGDADSDMSLLTELPSYYMDSRNPMEQRIMAVRRMDMVIGVRPPRVPGQVLLKNAILDVYSETFGGRLDDMLEHFPYIDLEDLRR